jgi:predicted phosphoribosyltransferase
VTGTFRDRTEAGKLLAEHLLAFADRRDVLVLALPRGGVPVAAQVVQRLHVPLDICLVRKLGFPGQPELAMGAIASGGVQVLNRDVTDALRVPAEVIAAVAAEEEQELLRRESLYRSGRGALDVRGKTAILIDDGVATGSTMLAAVASQRERGAASIIVASPTMPQSTFQRLQKAADQVVAVITPREFFGVGQWYAEFPQTSDEEVRELLAGAQEDPPDNGSKGSQID